eukprot:m.286949 g.286949  ORF g.286949 m.286949 type:complete len:444 (-) comp15785_c0_seq2:1310-2641(-)
MSLKHPKLSDATASSNGQNADATQLLSQRKWLDLALYLNADRQTAKDTARRMLSKFDASASPFDLVGMELLCTVIGPDAKRVTPGQKKTKRIKPGRKPRGRQPSSTTASSTANASSSTGRPTTNCTKSAKRTKAEQEPTKTATKGRRTAAKVKRIPLLHDKILNEDVDGIIDMVGAHPQCLEKQDRRQRTPLFVAATKGSLMCVTLLLSLGANPNAPSVNNDTPLHAAMHHNHVKVSRALLEHGADDMIVNDDFQTCRELGMRRTQTAVFGDAPNFTPTSQTAPKRTHLKKSSAASSAVSAAPSDPSTTTTPAASNAPSAPSTPSTAPTNGEEKDDAHKRRAVKRQGVKRRMSKRPSAQWQLRSEDINVSDTEEVDGVSFGFSSKPPYAALYNKFDAPQFLFACAKKLSNEKSVVLAASRQGYLPGAGLGTPTSAGAMPSTSA